MERYKLVYSDPRARTHTISPPGTGRARVRLERHGRAGKTVTVVAGLALSQAQSRILLKELQTLCATGGTMKDNRLELQGDFRQRAATLLRAKGYSVAIG